MLTKAEIARLLELQLNYKKSIDSYGLKDINILDLALLLQHDEHIRSLICDIVNASDEAAAEESEVAADENQPAATDTPLAAAPIAPRSVMWHGARIITPPPSPPPPQDPLRAELAPEFQLLNLIRHDAELARAWLGEHAESPARQLVRLIAVASQWSQIQVLWDRLAERCRTEQRPAHTHERHILDISLTLHNLVWDGLQARLEHAETGVPFNHDDHERGTPTGDTVRAEWLPSLFNAAGHRLRKTLVAT